MRRVRCYPDWPSLIALVAPIPAGIVLGLCVPTIGLQDGLGVIVGTLIFVLPAAIAASYWLSCRVADRSGQPLAFISFFVALAGWWYGIGLFFSIAGDFRC